MGQEEMVMVNTGQQGKGKVFRVKDGSNQEIA
jgi:hypothetical protein